MTVKSAAARFANNIVKTTHRLLGSAPASRNRVCVYGSPDYEENSLVAAIVLAEVEFLKVTLLAKNPQDARRFLGLLNRSGAPVDIVNKHSFRGMWRASTAGMLLFTHGLYGSPDLTAGKLVVNLWHGIGPKATRAATSLREPIPFHLMTCNSPVWAATTARELGSPDAQLVATGNPRELALQMPPDPSSFERLGVTPSSYVLWMPTFRSSNAATGRNWQDAATLSGGPVDSAAVDPVEALARMARAADIEVVVKPHPLDADLFERSGLRVITTEEIFDAGMSLYQFIGSSAAMISDYSSVWVEYLGLDRPLLLYCPDIAEYVAGRGLNEPYMTEVVTDLITGDPETVVSFLECVKSGNDWHPEARAAARQALGVDGRHIDKGALIEALLQGLQEHDGRRGRGAARRSAANRAM